MQAAMGRLESLVRRRRRLVLLAWVLVVLAALPFAARQTEELTGGGYEVPGSGSSEVAQAVERFPGIETEPLAVLLDNRGGDRAALGRAIDRVAGTVGETEGVDLGRGGVAAGRAQAGEDVVLLPLVVQGGADETVDAAVDLREELGIAEQEGAAVPIHLVGQQALWAGMQQLTKEDLESAELIGFPIVFVILLAVFGSLAAALLPLGLGFVAVILTGAGIFFLSRSLEMSVFVTNIASMLGIGVAVDYSLFILARYREEIGLGRTPDDARHTAMRTSGVAVAVSGVTVLISLAGLFLIDSTTMRSMAIGAILVVTIAIVAAVVLLPALIGALGRRAYEPGRLVGRLTARRGRTAGGAAARPEGPGWWGRWTERVMRRPGRSALAASAVMLVIAIPAVSLQTGNAALAQFPEGFETRVGVELAATAVGPGESGPILVVAEFAEGGAAAAANPRAVSRFRAATGEAPDVRRVAEPIVSRDGEAALIGVVPSVDPEGDRAIALMNRLRGDVGADLRGVADVEVGGATAAGFDFSQLIEGSLWKIVLFVMGLSYLVLLLLLRSVVLPLKAVVMNLLSVAAATGVLVAVFQWEWVDGFLGFQSLGYLNPLTPPLLLAIVFGLSMDYEVFLLSRIRERYSATGDNRRAVAEGLAASAKTITSAALIMVAVFAVFAGTGVPSIKEIGVGLSVAIALDATIVRLVLVPATMEMMGGWNWWVPGWLDRILPHTDFEASEPPPAPAAEPQPKRPAVVA